jgi:hypothetical protein
MTVLYYNAVTVRQIMLFFFFLNPDCSAFNSAIGPHNTSRHSANKLAETVISQDMFQFSMGSGHILDVIYFFSVVYSGAAIPRHLHEEMQQQKAAALCAVISRRTTNAGFFFVSNPVGAARTGAMR